VKRWQRSYCKSNFPRNCAYWIKAEVSEERQKGMGDGRGHKERFLAIDSDARKVWNCWLLTPLPLLTVSEHGCCYLDSYFVVRKQPRNAGSELHIEALGNCLDQHDHLVHWRTLASVTHQLACSPIRYRTLPGWRRPCPVHLHSLRSEAALFLWQPHGVGPGLVPNSQMNQLTHRETKRFTQRNPAGGGVTPYEPACSFHVAPQQSIDCPYWMLMKEKAGLQKCSNLASL
jgi:hypothetical protein